MFKYAMLAAAAQAVKLRDDKTTGETTTDTTTGADAVANDKELVGSESTYINPKYGKAVK